MLKNMIEKHTDAMEPPTQREPGKKRTESALAKKNVQERQAALNNAKQKTSNAEQRQ